MQIEQKFESSDGVTQRLNYDTEDKLWIRLTTPSGVIEIPTKVFIEFSYVVGKTRSKLEV